MSKSFSETYQKALLHCIQQAIHEDLNTGGDHTTKAIFPSKHQSKAKLVAKGGGVLAGVDFCKLVLANHAPNVKLTPLFFDGAVFSKGETLFTIEGDTQEILSLERILLNALQRMSGIATVTQFIQQSIAHTSCKVLDTRKTTPNFRIAEKWAVAIGGGVNHRMGLYDAIMLKDNHVDFCGGLLQALKKTKSYLDSLPTPIPVIVETRTLEDVGICLQHKWISRVLLDNMSPNELTSAVKLIDGALPTEASGNITPENCVSYAESGVDFISLGYITHSAPIIDLSLGAI